LLSLLFSVPLDSVKNLGVVFIPNEGSGGYEGVSISVKKTEDLLRAQSRFLSKTYLYSRLDSGHKREGLSLRIMRAGSLCITAGPERLQICVKISKKFLQVAGTTMKPLFFLYKPVKETGHDINSPPQDRTYY